MNIDEYGQYFFSLIQRAPGQNADDWEGVLGGSGIPKGLAPHAVPDESMPHHALTQQIGSDGRIAGRIFLPTASPDDKGYYSHPMSPLADGANGKLIWEWRDLGGPPVVTPGESSQQPSSGLTKEEVQNMIDVSLAAFEGVKLGDKIALRTNSGKLAGIQGGGPTVADQPINWIGKEGDAHAWESLTIEKGE